jgi:hypothetical protein
MIAVGIGLMLTTNIHWQRQDALASAAKYSLKASLRSNVLGCDILCFEKGGQTWITWNTFVSSTPSSD